MPREQKEGGKEEGKQRLTLTLNDAHDIVDRPRSAHKLVHDPPFHLPAASSLLLRARTRSTSTSDDNNNLLNLSPDAVPLLVPNSFPKLDQLFRFGEREGDGERVGFGAEAVVAIVVGRRVREREGERQGRGVVDAHERRGRRRLFVRVREREGGGGFCRIGVERETVHADVDVIGARDGPPRQLCFRPRAPPRPTRAVLVLPPERLADVHPHDDVHLDHDDVSPLLSLPNRTRGRGRCDDPDGGRTRDE